MIQEYNTDVHAYMQFIIIMSISLRYRDIKHAVGNIRNHMILKSRTSLHIFQHKSTRWNIPLIRIYANTRMHTNNQAFCMHIYDMHTYTSRYVHVLLKSLLTHRFGLAYDRSLFNPLGPSDAYMR